MHGCAKSFEVLTVYFQAFQKTIERLEKELKQAKAVVSLH